MRILTIILGRAMMDMSSILNSISSSTGILAIAMAAVLLALLFLFLLIVQKKNAKNLKENKTLLDELIGQLDLSMGLEKSLADLLSLFSRYVPGQDYAFYIFDKKNNNYVLKSVSAIDDAGLDSDIVPSYSGLLPYKKEKYVPPLSLPRESFFGGDKALGDANAQNCPWLVEDGHVPILSIPVKGGLGIIRVSPVSEISPKTFRILCYISEKLQPILSVLIEADELKSMAKSALSAEKAVHNISSIFTNLSGMLDVIMGISMKAMGASGGLFIKEEGGDPDILAERGLTEEGQKLMRQDKLTLGTFSRLVGDNQYYIFKKGDSDYLEMPSHLVALGAEVVLLIGVPYEKGRCIAVFWGPLDMELYAAKDYQITAALIMAKRMVDILDNYIKFKEYSKSYIKMLKFLANMVDNLSPYTVGYSELMSRYSTIIAREMNLSKNEIKDISLAAYLSNIGVLGLSDDLFHKKGKYTDFEYDMMKLHTEVGASLIEATIANRKVADYIRYHHERFDGNGYMAGLKGEEIPVGARIIAVVQDFLAKIMGREYRSPLPFKDAINLLKSASYTQLDARIVDILVGWFDRKQRENMNNRCSLGYCWEMRCCPESVSAGCPVYQNTRINCWDAPDNNCKAHGNSCSTCYIYTEYQHRMDRRI